jgi:hypothetical protein
MIKVKPAEGRRVQLPGGKWVPDGGVSVVETSFIRRRIKAGDLVIVGGSAAATPEAPEADAAATDAAPKASVVEPVAQAAAAAAPAAAETPQPPAAPPAPKPPAAAAAQVAPAATNEVDQGARPVKGN